MANNEINKLYRLEAPFLPALGEVFALVSAVELSPNGFPTYYGEFFLFSTRGGDGVVGEQMRVSKHVAYNGESGVFELCLERATASMYELIANRSGTESLAAVPITKETDWDRIETLYRAGVLGKQVLDDIQQRSVSSGIVLYLRDVLEKTVATFEVALRS